MRGFITLHDIVDRTVVSVRAHRVQSVREIQHRGHPPIVRVGLFDGSVIETDEGIHDVITKLELVLDSGDL